MSTVLAFQTNFLVLFLLVMLLKLITSLPLSSRRFIPCKHVLLPHGPRAAVQAVSPTENSHVANLYSTRLTRTKQNWFAKTESQTHTWWSIFEFGNPFSIVSLSWHFSQIQLSRLRRTHIHTVIIYCRSFTPHTSDIIWSLMAAWYIASMSWLLHLGICSLLLHNRFQQDFCLTCAARWAEVELGLAWIGTDWRATNSSKKRHRKRWRQE